MSAMGDERLDDLRARLDAIAEEIADMAHAKLREAVRTANAAAEAEERKLGRARRAVIKASVLLGSSGDGPGDDGL